MYRPNGIMYFPSSQWTVDPKVAASNCSCSTQRNTPKTLSVYCKIIRGYVVNHSFSSVHWWTVVAYCIK